MKATTTFKLTGAFAGMLLLVCAAYWIAFYTVAPSFDVTATRQAEGAYRFDISPNFIVSTVGRVMISGPKGTVAERSNRVAGAQAVFVTAGLTPGDTVSISCELNYDRVVPSTTEKTERLVIR